MPHPFLWQPTAVAPSTPAAAADSTLVDDDLAMFVPGFRRGDRLHDALEREFGSSAPPGGGAAVVVRSDTGHELRLKTTWDVGAQAPLRGHFADDHTLLLALPGSDTASRIRFVGALMEHNVGLIVDLSRGQSWRDPREELPSSWDGAQPNGASASIWQVDEPPQAGDAPSCAAAQQLHLGLRVAPQSGTASSPPQRCVVELLTLTLSLDQDALPPEHALRLVRHCQRFRETYHGERVAFLSVNGLGPAVALAGAERLFQDWVRGDVLPGNVEAQTLTHARDLRKRCGPLAVRAQELITMADLAEALATRGQPSPVRPSDGTSR